MKTGVAGTKESNDAMISVFESDMLEIEIQSIVDLMYHDQIEKVIRETLKEEHIQNIRVVCVDKGALDYTIRARLITALKRMKSDD
ncbi:MAG: citrate lyase acyl carrier protein [Candidatus Izemoplasmatales bacterium]|jgi:citrate lyase subunit gamma (acyl carrier protein)